MEKKINRKNLTYIITSAILICITLLINNDTNAQRTKTSQRAGELRKAEKGLKDNRYYFYMIDSSVSNFASAEERRLFKEAAQRDIIAQLLFMKFLFKQSYIEIRKSQKILIGLYRKILNSNIKNTKKLLNEIAPAVVLLDQHRPKHYLHLGYRDVKTAQIFMLMADNYRETLYSMRLYKYAKAIKKTKHGRRYGLLAMINTKIRPREKDDFERPDYDQIREKVIKYAPEEKRDYYLSIHQDNYYLTKGDKSYYDVLWQKMDVNEIEDYQNYMDKDELVTTEVSPKNSNNVSSDVNPVR